MNRSTSGEVIIKEKKSMPCNVHGIVDFVKHKNGNSKPTFRCMKCSAEAVQKNVQRKRDKAYEKFGDSCILCGYSRCKNALEWHHIDPSSKELNPAKVFSRSWDAIVKELSKCVLLCSNCHREVHAGMVDAPKMGS